MMYDELIGQMRACCNGEPCEEANCGFNPKSDLDCIEQLLTRAADAIEGLSHAADQMAEWRKNRWIPVSEKLPPISEEVIVCTYTNMIRIWSLERYYPTVADVLWEREDGYYEDVSEVTHWMPLPQPPEDGET